MTGSNRFPPRIRRRRCGASTPFRPAWRGVTLIEALITLLVMSIGLLGMAALQVLGIQANTSAFRHSQATWFAYDMADRMRANLDLAADPDNIADHYDGIDVSNDTTASETDCGAGDNCTTATMARFDADEWRGLVIGLPGGTGTVDKDGTVGGRYLIRVMWDDDVAGLDPDNDDDARRITTGCPSDTTITQTCVEITVEP